MSERISDERLAEMVILADADVKILGDQRRKSQHRYAVRVAACLRELQQRRNGQWICPGCGLRQEHPQEDAGF